MRIQVQGETSIELKRYRVKVIPRIGQKLLCGKYDIG